METCRTAIGGGHLARGKNPWTARRFHRFARRIRLSLCLRHSAGLISSCVSRIITISLLNSCTSEGRPPTDPGQHPHRDFCADFSVCSRPPSHFSMNQPQTQSPLVAIVGPTASGKSALAVWLAQRLPGEVVTCDSTQL